MEYTISMNLASNFVTNVISAGSDLKSGLAAVINLNDKNFAEILEKQLKVQSVEAANNIVGSMGMPAGMEIQNLTETDLNNIRKSEAVPTASKAELFDYTRRQAVNFYNHYSKTAVIGLREFMSGAFNSN